MKFSQLLLLIMISTIIISCNSKKEKEIDLLNTDYIYLDENEFKLKNEQFFPIMLNYGVLIRKIDTSYIISPYKDYENPQIFEYSTPDSSLYQLEGHFKLIKEMGFNTIRVVGMEKLWQNNDSKNYYIPIHFNNKKSQSIRLTKNMDVYFKRISEILKIAKKFDLRIMLLIKSPFDNELREFTKKLLQKFKDNPTLFAYDFFNEPLYFDNKHLPPGKRGREKKEAMEIVKSWKDMMNEYAPNQLFTIGFSEPLEVFEWDPSILPVDFVAFHTYHPLRAPNEIYWYSKYVNKPWMIGETALPADNDSVPYEHQRLYINEAYQRVVNCGGAGFGWWGFQDVSWGGFEHDYTSLMNHDGVTFTSDSSHKIIGTLKPAAYEVKKLSDYKPNFKCPCWDNYSNMLGYNNYMIEGIVINEYTKEPIEGAVVRGWNENWSIGANTYTNQKGQFTLYSNIRFVHFLISAPGMSKKKFDYKPGYKSVKGSITEDSLKDKLLEYHDISYEPFLKDLVNIEGDSLDRSNSIFNFKEVFDKAKFIGEMKPVYLEPIK